ncbi:MAG TPA: DUF4446 family protein [Euzebya sp.]|nr:DUF4446 family protein [Euzebya sp.]
MEFSPATIGTLLIVAILLSIGAIAVGVMAVQAERRVKATYSRFARGRREDVVTLLEMHLEEVQKLQTEVRKQQAYGRQLRALLARSISRIGTVRYDAFDDMGGRLSFSMALLDEHGDGSVVTAMNGRVQTRTFAKPVVAGSSTHNLSEEEVQAIAQAMDDGSRRAAEVTQALPSPAEVEQSELVTPAAPVADGEPPPADTALPPPAAFPPSSSPQAPSGPAASEPTPSQPGRG